MTLDPACADLLPARGARWAVQVCEDSCRCALAVRFDFSRVEHVQSAFRSGRGLTYSGCGIVILDGARWIRLGCGH